jgi:putative ABC transport system ATP-binding protein
MIIETERLTKIYKMGTTLVHALRGVDLRVQEGEFVALMGASGSGKSTLLHLLGCLDTPTSGTYCLSGQDISHLSRSTRSQVRNQQIGFVFQTFNLLPRLSAVENVALPLLYRGRVTGVENSAAETLHHVGLGDRLHHRPTELSGGERQRVAIARALINDPSLLLADEPTGNLDSATGDEIMNLLASLHSQGRTIVMVTHDAHIAAYAKRTLHMQDGRLAES